MFILKCITFHVELLDQKMASKPSYFVYIKDCAMNALYFSLTLVFSHSHHENITIVVFSLMFILKFITFHVEPSNRCYHSLNRMIASMPSYFVYIKDSAINALYFSLTLVFDHSHHKSITIVVFSLMFTLKCIIFHVEPLDRMMSSKSSYFVFIRDCEINVFHWVQRLARINLRDDIRHSA
jgi:hypothetical protein